MTEKITDRLVLLREPFKPNEISKLPKPLRRDAPKGKCDECGGWHGLPAIHLNYVGHAALTSRLLDCDPLWSWEPLAVDESGLPLFDKYGGMWITLTVCGHSRLGYGDSQGKAGPDAVKEVIGDALRNAAMRFGAALDLWHKGDLKQVEHDDDTATPVDQPEPGAPHITKENNKYKGFTGPHKTMMVLQAAVRELRHDINGCGDLDSLIALKEASIATIEQCKIDKPTWYHGEGDDEGLLAHLKRVHGELQKSEFADDAGGTPFPGDLPITAGG